MRLRVSWARAVAVERATARRALTGAELERHDRLARAGDRARFVAGRLLCRQALAVELGLAVADVWLQAVCPRCGGAHGKPVLPAAPADLDFSIAHAGEHVVVAVARGAAVGVDVEATVAAASLAACADGALAGVERRALRRLPAAARPHALTVTWARKEALLKALGTGLETPLQALALTAPSAAPAVLAAPPPLAGAWLRDLDAGAGYAAAVALLAPRAAP